MGRRAPLKKLGHEHGLFRARPAFKCAFARTQPLAKSTHEATAPSGGACAVWGHNPRWVRIFSITSGWSIKISWLMLHVL